jgi:hypothetical protein
MNSTASPRTTIALKLETKKRLDACRAPGQCYDGFISQMLSNWEQDKNSFFVHPNKSNQGTIRITQPDTSKQSNPLP